MSALNRELDFEKLLDRRVSTHGARGMAAGQGKFVVEGRRPSAALPCHVSSMRNAFAGKQPIGSDRKPP